MDVVIKNMIGNQIKTTFFLALLAGIFIAVGSALAGTIGMVIGFLIAMGINFASYWYSDKIVLKMHSAKPAPKNHKLYKIVEELAEKANLPMPKVYLIQAPSPNAFATGRNPKNAAVAATESLLELMTEEEVKGVMAHELSHVKHRDTLIQTIAVGFSSALAMVAEILQWSLIFGMGGDEDNPLGGIVGTLAIAILAPIIATIIQLAISRQREFLADEGSAKILGSHKPLVNALKKLESSAKGETSHAARAPTESLYIINPFKASALFKLFSTHPSTKDRINKLESLKL